MLGFCETPSPWGLPAQSPAPLHHPNTHGPTPWHTLSQPGPVPWHTLSQPCSFSGTGPASPQRWIHPHQDAEPHSHNVSLSSSGSAAGCPGLPRSSDGLCWSSWHWVGPLPCRTSSSPTLTGSQRCPVVRGGNHGGVWPPALVCGGLLKIKIVVVVVRAHWWGVRSTGGVSGALAVAGVVGWEPPLWPTRKGSKFQSSSWIAKHWPRDEEGTQKEMIILTLKSSSSSELSSWMLSSSSLDCCRRMQEKGELGEAARTAFPFASPHHPLASLGCLVGKQRAPSTHCCAQGSDTRHRCPQSFGPQPCCAATLGSRQSDREVTTSSTSDCVDVETPPSAAGLLQLGRAFVGVLMQPSLLSREALEVRNPPQAGYLWAPQGQESLNPSADDLCSRGASDAPSALEDQRAAAW